MINSNYSFKQQYDPSPKKAFAPRNSTFWLPQQEPLQVKRKNTPEPLRQKDYVLKGAGFASIGLGLALLFAGNVYSGAGLLVLGWGAFMWAKD